MTFLASRSQLSLGVYVVYGCVAHVTSDPVSHRADTSSVPVVLATLGALVEPVITKSTWCLKWRPPVTCLHQGQDFPKSPVILSVSFCQRVGCAALPENQGPLKCPNHLSTHNSSPNLANLMAQGSPCCKHQASKGGRLFGKVSIVARTCGSVCQGEGHVLQSRHVRESGCVCVQLMPGYVCVCV